MSAGAPLSSLLQLPQALLLALPLLFFALRLAPPRGPRRWLRVALALLLPLALARPVFPRGGDGLDLLVLVDRSRSMPDGSDALAEELLGFAEDRRQPGQRLGVVGFGRAPRLERPLSADGRFGSFQLEVDAEASDLAGALELAEQLLPPGRAGRVLVLSDGLATGADPRPAARRLAARGVPVDFRHLARRDAARDAAVLELEAPGSLSAGESFLLRARLFSSSAREAGWRLTRDGAPVAQGRTHLPAGHSSLVLRDRLERPGLAEYRLEFEGLSDAIPENDAARAVARADAPPRLLLVRRDGRPGMLAEALSASGLSVETRAPGFAGLEALEGVAAVVLEDVPAQELGDGAMRALELFVRERGGGLLMTGGPTSFGAGGYLRSRLEELLPVTLELREEQRRSRMALVIAMDRSGSMSLPARDGRPKIALAAEGALAALTLLGEDDEAAVWVVDERAHAIVPLGRVGDGLELDRVASIESMGGGIFVYEALEAAGLQAVTSELPIRHVILFADAADSEEPGRYRELLADLAAKKVTVSVIGLGTPQDQDAALLAEVAALGGGRVWFADGPEALPRLFAQETILVASASFVEERAPLAPGPELAALGPAAVELLAPPAVDAHNLTWLRPGAGVAYRTADEAKAPILALWQRGLGRVAALTAPADGPRAASLAGWNGYRPLVSKLARWLAGPADLSPVVVRSQRHGHRLEVTAELDPDQAPWTGEATASLLSADGEVRRAPLRMEADGRLTAQLELSGGGTVFPVVRIGDRVTAAAPATLPYAPEFEPRPAGEGRALLGELAALGGGVERLSVDGLFERAGDAPGATDLAPLLAALALALLLAEVAARRFLSSHGAAARAPGRERSARARGSETPPPAARPAGPAGSEGSEGSRDAPGSPGPSVPEAAVPGKRDDEVQDALAAARSRASRRFER